MPQVAFAGLASSSFLAARDDHGAAKTAGDEPAVTCRSVVPRSTRNNRDGGPGHKPESWAKPEPCRLDAWLSGRRFRERTAASVTEHDLEIQVLGPCSHPSPLADRLAHEAIHYVGQADRVLLDDRLSGVLAHEGSMATAPAFELAGPRHQVFFEPSRLRAGIVTCGGLCPGLNNVIRGLVLELTQGYGVAEVLGFRWLASEGLVRGYGTGPVRLTPTTVADIQAASGKCTALGTSRGEQNPDEVVDRLEELGIGVLFAIGGDGTFRGAMAIVDAIARRGLSISVIGVPKTIDNDIHFIDRSFGFETAFSAAVEVIRSAHVEATGARNGIGVVKLMGRHSASIATMRRSPRR